ncbi:hypothetical protein [Gelidibacter salicanalis]|uniref:Uncharacterized protein n=1 Tax=Gelidibacter salicanalis TaxID=291193 RepID=A0A934KQT1_9FLAO|nr:hypothetical protein [Gelidibacter salicanalis]MBJ7880400.1 hypothetical protein [Gelidibacter salicanalis]
MKKIRHLKEITCQPSACFLLIIALLLTGCQSDNIDPLENNQPLASAYSIFINEGKLLISGFAARDGQLNTQYWVDSEVVNQTDFENLVNNRTLYREAVDDKYRTVYAYKDEQGELQKHQFDQGSLSEDGRVFFYKNDVIKKLDTVSLGTISALTFFDDKPYYIGYFGTIEPTEAGNSLSRETPFIWKEDSTFNELPLPPQVNSFQGTTNLYVHNQNEFYVGGLVSFPMYWKNFEPVVLDKRYGEVWQITKSGTDVYAVGLINKSNSNSTGHTACYWKNQELVELEDDAQAYGIFVEGGDVYVSGAVGHKPVNYRPCYWKNGVRVDLTF